MGGWMGAGLTTPLPFSRLCCGAHGVSPHATVWRGGLDALEGFALALLVSSAPRLSVPFLCPWHALGVRDLCLSTTGNRQSQARPW